MHNLKGLSDISPSVRKLSTVFKFLLRCGKKAGRFWKPLFNHLIKVHVGLKIFFKFGWQMFKKIEFSNLVHTKVLKKSCFFSFSPFGPNWAKFHLTHITKHVLIHFWGHSKCLQQAAVKMASSAGIWTPDPPARAKK